MSAQHRRLPAVGLPELGQRVRIDSLLHLYHGQTGIVVATDPTKPFSVRVRLDNDKTTAVAAPELNEVSDDTAARAQLRADRQRCLRAAKGDLENVTRRVISTRADLENAIATAARLTEYVALLESEIEEG